MSTYTLTILTPEKDFGTFEVSSAVFPGADGEICVLPGHMPMLLSVAVGELRLKIGEEWKTALISDGFCEVMNNKARLFTDRCLWKEDAADAKALTEAWKREAPAFSPPEGKKTKILKIE